jgi:putative addiction module killer protein
MTTLEVVSYVDLLGRSPFNDWFEQLDPDAASAVTVALYRMAAGNPGDVKAVGSGVLERRIHHGPGYRVYFGRDGERVIVLLAGGTKRRQSDDILAARKAWRDYRSRRRHSGTLKAED